MKSLSSSTSPFHYLILREYFVPFPPGDVMDAPQPGQIQVTTFIFTIVSRDRQKKQIYLQRLCWSYQGETGKNWNVCCPVEGTKTMDKLRNSSKGCCCSPDVALEAAWGTSAHQTCPCPAAAALGHVKNTPWASELIWRLDKTFLSQACAAKHHSCSLPTAGFPRMENSEPF